MAISLHGLKNRLALNPPPAVRRRECRRDFRRFPRPNHVNQLLFLRLGLPSQWRVERGVL